MRTATLTQPGQTQGRNEALLYTLECKYLVTITSDGRIEPQKPFDAYEAHLVVDEVDSARRASQRLSLVSGVSEMTDLTTGSFKGYAPVAMSEGGLPPSTLLSSWAVPTKLGGSGHAARPGAPSSVATPPLPATTPPAASAESSKPAAKSAAERLAAGVLDINGFI